MSVLYSKPPMTVLSLKVEASVFPGPVGLHVSWSHSSLISLLLLSFCHNDPLALPWTYHTASPWGLYVAVSSDWDTIVCRQILSLQVLMLLFQWLLPWPLHLKLQFALLSRCSLPLHLALLCAFFPPTAHNIIYLLYLSVSVNLHQNINSPRTNFLLF